MMYIRGKLKKAAALLLLLTVFALPAAGASLSPALDILANDLSLVKSAAAGSEIKFSAEDFDRALGVKVESITIATLPPKESGVLMVGDQAVKNGQTIERKSFSKLRFVPSADEELKASFTFKGESRYAARDIECTLYILTDINFAPTVSLVNTNYLNVSTYKDVKYYGTMKAADPENDALTYQITAQPSKGILTVTDLSYGTYVYSPNQNYTGKDSFKYVVSDKYGNVSDEITVKIKIQKNSEDVYFSDMEEHWAYNAVIKTVSEGIMAGVVGDSGELLFNPEDKVTRCEFLAMAMKAAGYTVKGSAVNTGFLDNSDIPEEYKGCVAAALELGFIKGTKTAGGYMFYPNNSITRAEAAVILNNIVSLPVPAVKAVFADTGNIPAWASDAIYALNESGIINGVGEGYISPYSTLTRAQTAQILYGILNI